MCSDRIDMDRCERLRGNIRKYFVENQAVDSTEVTPLTFRAEHSKIQGPDANKVCTVFNTLGPFTLQQRNFPVLCLYPVVCDVTVTITIDQREQGLRTQKQLHFTLVTFRVYFLASICNGFCQKVNLQNANTIATFVSFDVFVFV